MLTVLLRPITFVLLFAVAHLLAYAAWPVIPARMRPLLYRQMSIIPRTEAERRDWRPALYLTLANILIFGFVTLLIVSGQ